MSEDTCLVRLTRREWLTDGPLSGVIAEYIELLRKNRYAEHTITSYLISLAHYSYWAKALHLAQQIQAIPMKRFEKPILGFLSRTEIRALLVAPDANTWCGRRDRILLALLYNTGASVNTN